MSRQYTLMNGRALVCQFFGYHPAEGGCGRFLGGGYVGVDGGLSANLVLFGLPEDVASGRWAAVEAILSGILMNNRERRYREAGLSVETMKFVEYAHGEEPWRRDFASYFGFTDADAFYEKFSKRGMTAYNFTVKPGEATDVFNEILALGIRLPSRYR